MSGKQLASFLALALLAPHALSHSPYLFPDSFASSDRDHVSVQASFTEDFYVPDVVMKGEAHALTLDAGE